MMEIEFVETLKSTSTEKFLNLPLLNKYWPLQNNSFFALKVFV